ncbi:YcxB family protein [Candidatus Xianfuyuplasma coldseepsis]|uniref:YcxB family protein n=1 Tax=Candidatus Xianfuyuplasma coldseepsis TaxID=2782163 RepID=A0A7L7KSN4_9MOLU|nr:YcxB family protein [Xianfuyuplasma coldseepsis]QMS85753.1 YcxB family protein [Xianfuyuplasma coldseepsis]
MEYHFNQHVTREDYIAFLMNHLRMNIFKPTNLIFFTIGIGYLAVAPFITGTQDFTFTFIGLGLVLVMILSILFARYNAGKRYDKNPGNFDMSYTVDDNGFSYNVSGQKIETPWMNFYSASETEDYLYVFVSKDSGSVIVKRDVPNDAIEFIKTKLQEHVNAKKINFLK